MKRLVSFKLVILVLFALLSIELGSARADTVDTKNQQNGEGCVVDGVLPVLSVGGEDGVIFAQATYEFDANCNPILVEQIRLDYIPQWISEPEQIPAKVKSVPRVIAPLAEKNAILNGFSIESVNTCHAKTWEEDAPGLDMISVQDDQIYFWDNSTVTLGQGSTSAAPHFSWWYVNSGPTGSGGYYDSQRAWAHGEAGFYCDGGPFCGGGPTYYITLKNDIAVDYTGWKS